MRLAAVIALAMATLGFSARAQEPARPTADVYIRSQAGLPASSAKGDIEVLDIGHNPLDTMLSIVGHRTAGGWRISYVCAQSPICDKQHFVVAKEFDLAPDAARRLDAALAIVEAEPEAAPPQTAPPIACGRLGVNIDDRGVKRSYRRVCDWAKAFGDMEKLMKAGLP